MRLDELVKQSVDLRSTIDEMLREPNRYQRRRHGAEIFVRAYIVRPHWRHRPKRQQQRQLYLVRQEARRR
jgi:hypothetical protein